MVRMIDRDSTYYMVFDKAHWNYLSDSSGKYRFVFDTKEEAIAALDYQTEHLAAAEYSRGIDPDLTIVMVHHVETEIGRQ